MPTYTEHQWVAAALDGILADPDLRGNTQLLNGAFLWVELMKQVINQPHLRDAIDINVDRIDTLVNASTEQDSGGGVLYGVFAWCTDTSEATLVQVRDTTTTYTMNSAAMNAGEDTAGPMVLVNIPAATAATVAGSAFGTVIIPEGVAMGTGINWAADGVGGNAPAANACKAYIVYRSTVEVRV